MLNVLSIDWDYFVHATAEQRLFLFPDSPNELYSEETKNMIWAFRYAGSEDLLKIKVDPLIYKVVSAIKSVPIIIIGESHRFAYSFVKDLMKRRGERSLYLLNIDYHHDCEDDIEDIPGDGSINVIEWLDCMDVPKNLHCGNWLRLLMEEVNGSYVWLGRKDSDKYKKAKKLRFIKNYNSAKIERTRWDMVYICRSDLWSPPHLDAEFTKVFKPLSDGCKAGATEDGIWENRSVYLMKYRKPENNSSN